jgi:hypothetical protein
MILTKVIIEQGKSRNGGFSGKQFKCLGIGENPKKGWLKELMGKEIPDENIEKFLALKNKHLKIENVVEDEVALFSKWFWAVVIYGWVGGFEIKN